VVVVGDVVRLSPFVPDALAGVDLQTFDPLAIPSPAPDLDRKAVS
jgi:hypothetical protein